MTIEEFIRESLADPDRRRQLEREVARRERLIRDVADMDRRLLSAPDSVSEKELRLLESVLGWSANVPS